MRLSLLFAGVYATVTSACMFPFNNPHLTNSSMVEDYAADLQAKLGDGGQDGGGNGWASIIGRDGIKPWPKNSASGTLTYIYYCYAQHADFAGLKDVVEAANVMWRNKLGPGSLNGHHFDGFRHYYNRGVNHHPRCYTQFPEPFGWSPLVPEGTLVIEWNHKPFSDATYGYRDYNNDPDRHVMRLDTRTPRFEDWVPLVAHELGHVFGLVHEHQRTDRDQELHYDCSKLVGYAQARAKMEANPNNYPCTIDDVCQSMSLGATRDLDFHAPIDYSTDWGTDPLNKGRSIDHNSIMLYSSWSNAADLMHGLQNLPLVRWKNGKPADGSGPNHDNAETIQYPIAISDGDKEAIQRLYPM